MKIPYTNIPDSDQTNKLFNLSVKPIIEKIFSTQGLGEIRYIVSTEKNIENNRHKYISDDHSEHVINTSFNYSHIDHTRLGPCEKTLLNLIVETTFHTIVITGALGSGKSTVTNYVLDHIESTIDCNSCREFGKCQVRRPLIFRFDFLKLNTDFGGSREDRILDIFQEHLFIELTSRIYKLYSQPNVMQFFETELANAVNAKSNPSWCNYFVDFYYNKIQIPNVRWDKKNAAEKTSRIIAWIKSETRIVENRITKIMQLFACLRTGFPDELQGCYIFLFDNIDSFKPSVQVQIMTYLGSLADNSGVLVIVPMRLTTFGKLNNTLGARGYTTFQHAGPPPIQVIRHRLKHFKEQPEAYTLLSPEKSYANALNAKIAYLTTLFYMSNYESLREVKAFKAFAGNSIRRGLYLAERYLLHYAYKYNDTRSLARHDWWIRALIISTNPNLLMQIDDKLISNVFIDYHTRRNSLVGIRVLNILINYNYNLKKVTLFDLVTELRLFYYYDDETILSTIQYFNDFHKRLIFLLGNLDLSAAIVSNDRMKEIEIEITESGRLYFNYLLGDLTYVHSCFQCIDWSIQEIETSGKNIKNNVKEYINNSFNERYNTDSRRDSVSANVNDFILSVFDIPEKITDLDIFSAVDYHSSINWLGSIRKVLRVLLKQDALQMITYRHQAQNDLERPTAINNLVVNKIIVGLASSVNKMLRSTVEKFDISEEFSNWYSLLIIASEVEKSVIPGSNNLALDELIYEYSKVLF